MSEVIGTLSLRGSSKTIQMYTHFTPPPIIHIYHILLNYPVPTFIHFYHADANPPPRDIVFERPLTALPHCAIPKSQ